MSRYHKVKPSSSDEQWRHAVPDAPTPSTRSPKEGEPRKISSMLDELVHLAMAIEGAYDREALAAQTHPNPSTVRQPAEAQDEQEAVKEMENGLACLYIAVAPSIADDVILRVREGIAAIKQAAYQRGAQAQDKALRELVAKWRARKKELYLPYNYEYNGYATACGEHADELEESLLPRESGGG